VSAEEISAWASVGTLVVILVSALAAFVQLRHMSVLNGLTVLNEFSKEYERVEGAATAALPVIEEHLEDFDARMTLAAGGAVPEWARPAMPLIRLFEILGNYTNRNIVPPDLVMDMWAPVVLHWWEDFAPFIAVMRRLNGPTMLENWEAIAVRARSTLESDRSSYPKRLPRIGIVDPWPDDPTSPTRSDSDVDSLLR
jgi:hypothetical protein